MPTGFSYLELFIDAFARVRWRSKLRRQQERVIQGLIAIAALLFLFALSASAQTDCPPDKVCITPEQARHYLNLEDTAKAKDAEIATLKNALADQKNITADIKIELAKAIGEKTGAEQQVVRLSAIVDLLLKSVRPKKIGLINF